MTVVDITPVMKSHSRHIRKFVDAVDAAIEHARYLTNEGIPFTVRTNDRVISGKKWLPANEAK